MLHCLGKSHLYTCECIKSSEPVKKKSFVQMTPLFLSIQASVMCGGNTYEPSVPLSSKVWLVLAYEFSFCFRFCILVYLRPQTLLHEPIISNIRRSITCCCTATAFISVTSLSATNEMPKTQRYISSEILRGCCL